MTRPLGTCAYGDDGSSWHRGSPARAGMDPDGVRAALTGYRFPRTRGDGPKKVRDTPPYIRVPPHARGWTREGMMPASKGRGSSARTRMDLCLY